jgi:hypothetical protein
VSKTQSDIITLSCATPESRTESCDALSDIITPRSDLRPDVTYDCPHEIHHQSANYFLHQASRRLKSRFYKNARRFRTLGAMESNQSDQSIGPIRFRVRKGHYFQLLISGIKGRFPSFFNKDQESKPSVTLQTTLPIDCLTSEAEGFLTKSEQSLETPTTLPTS